MIEIMAVSRPDRRVDRWLQHHLAAGLLLLTGAGLAVGGALHITGAASAGDIAWLVVSCCGLGYAVWSMLSALRRRRVGVDLIAVLALGGAIAVGELLAAVVISFMLASGRALEGWAAGRARRDLTGLLERAPRTARRYQGEALHTVSLDDVLPGDKLLIATGDVVPADGSIVGGQATLDESALTGEPLPVAYSAGESIRSGAISTGRAFDLVTTASAADSTYAGIVAWSPRQRSRRRRSSGWQIAMRCGSCL